MLKIDNKSITMDKGDFGLPLMMRIVKNNGLISSEDTVTIRIKHNDTVIIEKEYKGLSTDEDGSLYFTFSLTKEESEKLTEKNYKYEVEAYRDNVYLNTLSKDDDFIVR